MHYHVIKEAGFVKFVSEIALSDEIHLIGDYGLVYNDNKGSRYRLVARTEPTSTLDFPNTSSHYPHSDYCLVFAHAVVRHSCIEDRENCPNVVQDLYIVRVM